MRLSTVLSLALLSATTLVAQDLQQLADNLKVKEPAAKAKRISLPHVKGAEVKFLAADYEQFINDKGRITRPLTDTPVRVSFQLRKGDQSAISKDYEITLKGTRTAKAGRSASARSPIFLLSFARESTMKSPA